MQKFWKNILFFLVAEQISKTKFYEQIELNVFKRIF